MRAHVGHALEMARHDDELRGAPELFQVSTLAALAHGENRGRVRIGDVLAHGDLGIGTVDHLGGELVILDGVAWRIRRHEHVERADPDELTPNAVATRFGDAKPQPLPDVGSMAELAGALDARRPDKDRVVAIRVDGCFDRIALRVACGAAEGERLVTAAGHQYEAEHEEVRGSLVGFWSPERLVGLDVVGYHLHAISDDRRVGGHVFDAAGRGLTARVQLEGEVHLVAADPGPIDAGQLAEDLGTSEERPAG